MTVSHVTRRALRMILIAVAALAPSGCVELGDLRIRTKAQEEQIAKLQKENAEFNKAYYQIKETLDSEMGKSDKRATQLARDLDQAKTIQTQREKDLSDELRTTKLEAQAFKDETLETQTAAEARQRELIRQLGESTALVEAQKKTLAEQTIHLAENKGAMAKLAKDSAEAKVAAQQAASRADKADKDLVEVRKAGDDARTELAAAQETLKKSKDDLAAAKETAEALASDRDDLKKQVEAGKTLAKEKEAAETKAKDYEEKLKAVPDPKVVKAEHEKDIQKLREELKPKTPADDEKLVAMTSALRKGVGNNYPFVRLRLDAGGLRAILPADDCFEENSVTLNERGKAAVKALAAQVAKAEGYAVHIEGHTDNQPVPADMPFPDNWRLGFARADAVREALAAGGVAAARLTPVSKADSAPISDENSAEARKKNRRVEIVVGAPE